jgi:hypothetical protein
MPVAGVLPNKLPAGGAGAEPNKDGAGGAPKTLVDGAPKPLLTLPNDTCAGAGVLPPNKPAPVAGAAPNPEVVVDDPNGTEPKVPPPPNVEFVG